MDEISISIKPMFDKLSEIEKEKQQIENEIERIALNVLRDDYSEIDKLSQYPLLILRRRLGDLLVAYEYYLIKNKKESDSFKSLFDMIFIFILENEYHLPTMKVLKWYTSELNKKLIAHSPDSSLYNIINEWYKYLQIKLEEIEADKIKAEFYNISEESRNLIYDLANIEYIVEESLKNIVESNMHNDFSETEYDILREPISYLLQETPIGFTIRNFGTIIKNMSYDASNTGNFKASRPGLLKLVDRCKDMSEITYLRRDSYSGVAQLTKLGQNKPNIKKQCDDHIKWIETEYRAAINKKAKDLRLNESVELLDEGLKDTAKRVRANITVAERKASEKIDAIADKIFGEVKAAKDEDERERIIRNSIPKASSVIKKAIVTGATFLVSPVIAIIGLLTNIAINKKTRVTQRRLILQELQTEQKIVEEKIRDAESENDKRKKYDLMRIQAKLERDIERIRYNLKY